jgi:hypothetical protein
VAHCSSIAGIDIEPVYSEISIVTLFQMGYEGERGDLIAENMVEKDNIIPWHTDKYPFACILMISDTSDMQGGETLLKTGSGVFEMNPPAKVSLLNSLK